MFSTIYHPATLASIVFISSYIMIMEKEPTTKSLGGFATHLVRSPVSYIYIEEQLGVS